MKRTPKTRKRKTAIVLCKRGHVKAHRKGPCSTCLTARRTTRTFIHLPSGVHEIGAPPFIPVRPRIMPLPQIVGQAHGTPAGAHTPADVLQEASNTFRERNAVYKSNYRMVGKLMAVLFPDGVPSALVTQDHFHLFELKLVKLSRFAISGLRHQDSIHDDMVYSAMIESILHEQATFLKKENT